MQAPYDKNPDDLNNYSFIFKCIGALITALAIIASVLYGISMFTSMAAKSAFAIPATISVLPAILILGGLIALCCLIPFAITRITHYVPNPYPGYNPYFFWTWNTPVAHTPVLHTPVVLPAPIYGGGVLSGRGQGPIIHSHVPAGGEGRGPSFHVHPSAGHTAPMGNIHHRKC